jgi:hypothetical protein
VGLKYSIVDLKKKLLELYKSCVRNITQLFNTNSNRFFILLSIFLNINIQSFKNKNKNKNKDIEVTSSMTLSPTRKTMFYFYI